MAEHDATTLTFVRTQAGVVKVPAGQRVPHDALPGEIDRLLAAGTVTEVAEPAASTDEAPADDDTPAATPRRTRRRQGSED